MKWTQITVFTTQEGIEPVCGRLSTLGIDQVQIQESREAIDAFLQETAKYWDFADLDELTQNTGPCVKAYVGNVADNAKLVEQIRQSFAELKAMDVGLDLGSLRVVAEVTDEEDWANNWKAYYKPLPIGERLLVCPSWEKADPGQRVLLSLDPGMAFGTGSHHTTRMCLELLEAHVRPGDTLLDLGCGSGILSIAALVLGQGGRRPWTSTPRRWMWPMKTPPSTASAKTGIPSGRGTSSPTPPWPGSSPGGNTTWCWPTSWPT